MNIAIDTSSLLSLVRYYLPFDKQNILYDIFKNKIESNEIIILDKVFEECKFVSQGVVISTLPYLEEKSNLTKTVEILPSKKFFNLLENQFLNPIAKRLLSEAQLEVQKDEYLESADAKLLLYSLVLQKQETEVVIVSEETTASNDRKPFRKIPAICNILGIRVIALPELLRELKINVEYK